MTNRFTVRVELHHADENDYERPHEEMEKNSFDKSIHFPKIEKDFALPTAEYRYHSETETNEQVVEKAYTIANRVKRNPSVISTQGAIAHRGLEEL